MGQSSNSWESHSDIEKYLLQNHGSELNDHAKLVSQFSPLSLTKIKNSIVNLEYYSSNASNSETSIAHVSIPEAVHNSISDLNPYLFSIGDQGVFHKSSNTPRRSGLSERIGKDQVTYIHGYPLSWASTFMDGKM